MWFFILREVVLGETIVGEDPDCEGCPSIMRRKISKDNLIVHEDYSKENQYANDIALIRLDKAVPLNQEDFNSSFINPICLPWSRGWDKTVSNKVSFYEVCIFSPIIATLGQND